VAVRGPVERRPSRRHCARERDGGPTGQRPPDQLWLMSALPVVADLWPIFVVVIILVITLAKMHSAITVLEDKVKVLFDLFNNRDRRQ